MSEPVTSRQTTPGQAKSRPLELGRKEASDPQSRLVQKAHEGFARGLSTALSAFLQSEIVSELDQIRPATAGDFQKSLPNPTCVIALKLHPRTERVILHFDYPTVFSLLELLLGGVTGASAPEPARELTEIEWSLLEEVVRILVRCLGEAWQIFHTVEFEVESLGSDPTLLPCPEPARPVAQISFGLKLGEHEGRFQIAVPQSFFSAATSGIEPAEGSAVQPPRANPGQNWKRLENAAVRLEVNLEGPLLPLGKLLELKPGQVVTFDHSLQKPLQGKLNGSIAMTGHVVSSGRKRAFQIDELP